MDLKRNSSDAVSAASATMYRMIIMTGEYVIIWKKEVVAYFKVLLRHSPEEMDCLYNTSTGNYRYINLISDVIISIIITIQLLMYIQIKNSVRFPD